MPCCRKYVHAFSALVVCTALAGPTHLWAAPEPGPVNLEVADGLGTPHGFLIWGRVLHSGGHLPAPPVPPALQPGAALLGSLDTSEVANARVHMRVAGAVYSVVTDEDGNSELAVNGLAQPLEAGQMPVQVTAQVGAVSTHAAAVLHVMAPPCTVLLISDWDDTVVQTHVTDRFRMAKTALTTRPRDVQPVPGTAQAYASALSAGACGVVYVSGSPRNLALRLRTVMKAHGLAVGPVVLRSVKGGPAMSQSAYKAHRIEHLLRMFPWVRVVLVGDDGEADPDIYTQVAARHPDRVCGVIIRSVSGRAVPRRKGLQVVKDFEQSPSVLAQAVRSCAAGSP